MPGSSFLLWKPDLSEDTSMDKLQTGLAAATIAATFVIGSITNASAAPIFVPTSVATQSDVLQVRDGVRWHNGHRGYRDYRHGYQRYDGWWFPAGAFITGALIGGAIANSNSYYDDDYYSQSYRPRYYQPRYYEPRYYEPRYYAPQRVYRQPDSYRAGYRQGYRDGYDQRYYRGRDITCTWRLQDAGKC